MTVLPARARARARLPLSIAAVLLPAAAAVVLVVRYGVDVPNWDEWLFVPFLERVAHGEAGLADWFAPHNDHVVLIPRLLLVGLAFTVGWNIWFGLAASLLFAGGTVWALRRLSRASAGDSALLLAADFATALLLFSLVQWENWLWGMQSAWFLANLCVALALVALCPGETPPGPRRIALAAGACLVATLTLAQGPFAWLALLPLVAWGGGRARPGMGALPGMRAVRSWLCLTGGAWGLLLLSLRNAPHAANTEAAVHDPMRAFQFFLALLGAPLAPAPDVAVALGILLLVAVVGLAVPGLRAAGRSSALPWCALGAFGIMVAAATALGRVGFGLDYALSSRYTTNAVLVWVAAWHLVRLRLQGLRPRVARLGTGALLAALLLGLGVTSRAAIENAQITRLSQSGGKACLELGALLEPTPLNEGPMLYLFMHPAGARRRFETLLELGVRRARPRPAFDRAADGRRGMITRAPGAAAPSSENDAVAGWTVVEDPDHPPIVLLSANDGRSFVAAQPLVEGLSPVGSRVHFRTRTVAEWEIPLGANGTRFAAGPLSAWRFDPQPNLISRLGGSAP